MLEEEASGWFEDVPFDGSPYMTMTLQAKEEVKDAIPAVLHVDGSARLQTVGPLAAPLYRALIRLFYALTVSCTNRWYPLVYKDYVVFGTPYS